MKIRKTILCCAVLVLSCSKKDNNNTTGTSTTVPSIQNFSPSQGSPGSTVKISGSNLDVITGVSINGVSIFYKIDNANTVEAEVPSTAKTGSISVTYPNGTISASGTFTILPMPDTTVPVILSVMPNSNPTDGPVLIRGNFDSIANISFNGISAPIDTSFTGTVTTRVPANLPIGLVQLTIKKKNGTSASVPFEIISSYPDYTIAAPAKIMLRKPAPYIIHVPNDWFSEYGNSGDNFFVEVSQPGPFGLGGPVSLNFASLSFIVSALDTAKKTVEFTVIRGFNDYGDSVNMVYKGNFTEAAGPNLQRIILFDPNGRQVVLRTSQ